MKRVAVFVYGVGCYILFLATFLYALGFIGNFGVPKSIDGGAEAPLWQAILTNASLLGVFAVQHSIMARRWFKNAWVRIVPEAAERSTYVLLSSLCLMLLFWKWEPMGGLVWHVESLTGRIAIQTVFFTGWGIVLLSTFLINHFDLFGLRQVWLYLRGRRYTKLKFGHPVFYKHVRHPLYLGWLLAFWAAPTMTGAHLLFALATTAYILIAIQFEERDLVREHGEAYRRYRESTPMILPVGRRRTAAAPVRMARGAGSTAAFVLALALAPAGPAAADILTFDFSGAVTQVAVDEAFGDIHVGDPIQGSYRFDSTAADLVPGSTAVGSYAWTSPFGMTATIGTREFTALGVMSIGVFNSFVDQFTVFAQSADGSVTLELLLQDNTGGAFGSDQLPSTPPDLSLFSLRKFQFHGTFDGGEVQVDGGLASAAPQPVPEPHAAALLLTASIPLYFAVRKRFC